MRLAVIALLVLLVPAGAVHAKGGKPKKPKPLTVSQARKILVKAWKEQRKQRWSRLDSNAFSTVYAVAVREKTPKAMDLMVDLATMTPQPYQRHRAVGYLATRLKPHESEPRGRHALRLADAAKELSLDIKPSSFVTPNWSIAEARDANNIMERYLATYYLNELFYFPEDAKAWVVDVMNHKGSIARRALARALIETAPPDLENAVVKRLRAERRAEVRALWIEVAAIYGVQEVQKNFVAFAAADDDAVRGAALRALATTPSDPEWRERRFLQGIDSEIPIEAALAAHAAGLTRRDAFAGRLGELLASPHWEVSAQAVDALAQIRSRRSIEVLVKTLPEMSFDVASRCRSALFRLTNQRFYDAKMWREWWSRNQSFQPNTSIPVTELRERIVGQVDMLPPEGRRFVVVCFLPGATALSGDEPAYMQKMFDAVLHGLDEEAAVGIRANGWWKIEGSRIRLQSDPKTSRSRYMPVLPAGLRDRGEAPIISDKKTSMIPYADATPQAMKTAKDNVLTIVKRNGFHTGSDRAIWKELEYVLRNAETESIVLLTVRDLPEVSEREMRHQIARLRWATVGRPIRVRMAHIGDAFPQRLIQVVEGLGGIWSFAPPPPKPEPKPPARDGG